MIGFTSSTDLDPSSQPTQNREPMGPAKTTEVTITTSDMGPSRTNRDLEPGDMTRSAYSVNVSTDFATSASPATALASAAEQGHIKPQRSKRGAQSQSNKAAISYTKCAALFFMAMLITWIPSSANRLYTLINGKSSLVLAYMSAFVLPLQGFWNALIFFSTSRAGCKDAFDSLRARLRRPKVSDIAGDVDGPNRRGLEGHQLDRVKPSKKAGRYGDTDSTTSLTPRTEGDSSDFESRA